MEKKPEEPKSFPLWQSTFSDLMNLLLCFFVLLFSMSTINEEQYIQVINSLQSAFTSVIATGGSTVVPGQLVSSGITQLPDFSNFFGDSLSKGNNGGNDTQGAGDDNHNSETSNSGEDNTSVNSNSEGSDAENAGQTDSNAQGQVAEQTDAQAQAQVEQAATNESEQMAERIEKLTTEQGIQDLVEVDFNGEYVRITMSGALLFDSAKAELRSEAVPIVQKLGGILNIFQNNLIVVEGHTDNVPIHSARYESNEVLSMYRAMYVANVLRENSTIDDSHIESAGRGDYVPVADNGTPEGRARNRRVEIKIYNSYNSGDITAN
ncbi:MAG: flagellar motor protein MotB [Lachnospiraceae bacterium]|nr:flagellar motor protein MotB [Lachnospiraceae bacterium]